MSLGGMLAVFNGLCWILLIVWMNSHVLFHPAGAFLAIILGLPLALWFALGVINSASVPGVVIFAVAIGVNSLVWGHVLARMAKLAWRTDGAGPRFPTNWQ